MDLHLPKSIIDRFRIDFYRDCYEEHVPDMPHFDVSVRVAKKSCFGTDIYAHLGKVYLNEIVDEEVPLYNHSHLIYHYRETVIKIARKKFITERHRKSNGVCK